MKYIITTALLVCLLAPASWPAQSSDAWTSIRTNNLFLISNAGEQELRQVAAWLELFHDSLARLLSKPVTDSSAPTTVIIFRDDASFTSFKPMHLGRTANVAGYFQPGPDVNYIVLFLERGNRDIFGTAFHEYVHLHLQDHIPNAPLWMNEGLAEFYGAFTLLNGEGVFGAPLPHHIRLLRSRELIPLATLFSIGHNSPEYNEQDKSRIFYAESWALVHYLMMAEGGRLRPKLTRFISLLSAGVSIDNAIQTAFGVNFEDLEKELREYVQRGEFATQRVTVGRGPDSYVAMQRAAISEAEANFYLGDLLLHISRQEDAEKYFQRAISLDPGFVQAHASLGMLYVRQNRFAEARKHLQRATVTTQTYLVHYFYAYVLSHDGVGADHGAAGYSREVARVMRDELGKAIKLAPQFADAYYLLAFVNLVTNEQLDESVTLAKRARSLEPGRLGYSLLLAQIYLRQREVESARQELESLARQNSDPEVRSEAQVLLDSINSSGPRATRDRSLDNTALVGSSIIRELERSSGAKRGLISGGRTTVGVSTEEGVAIDNSGPMPDVDQIIASYVEAVGGSKVLLAMTSRVVRGRVDVVGVSRGGVVEIYSKAPHKTLTVMKAEPLGQVKLGFNGRLGWAETAQGLRMVKGEELNALQRASDFYNPATLKDHYSIIRLLGRSKIGYREVYVLDMQPAAGAPERLYIDAKTYLPVRANAVRATVQGTVSAEIYFDDWTEVDGLKIPFRITQSFPGLTLVFTIEEVKHNVPLADSIFERPARR